MSLYPYAGAHAVQSAAFALEWAGELSDAELSSALTYHEHLKSALPGFSPIQTLAFQMQMGGGAQPVPIRAANIAGYIFSRPGQSGTVARNLEIHQNRIVGQVNDYTRWKPVWEEVKRWFDIVGPIIGTRKITHVGLQYNDVFHWRDAPDKLNLKEVFRADTTLLPTNALEQSSLWHSHHGYFSERTVPTKHRLLENINVNVVDELGQRSFVITTVHKAEVENIWGWSELEKVIGDLMEDLHKRNKEMLSKLLTESVCKNISLSKEGN